MSINSWVKLGIAAVLLFLIGSRVDFDAALDLMSGARPAWLLLALLTSFAIVFADGAYWTVSMRAVGCRIALKPAIVFSLVGWFFANLAPSSVGSDIFRAARMRLAGASPDQSIRLVAAARLMSFASLLVVIGAGLPFAIGYVDAAAEKFALAGAFAAAVIGFGAFILGGALVASASRRFGVGGVKLVAELSGDTRTLLVRASASGWFYLIAQHLLRVGGVAAVAWSLNASVDLIALFALVPAALLIAMVPISIGGWGVREASFVHFLGFAGVDPAAALAISIVYGLTRLVIGALGGVAFVLARRHHYSFDLDKAPATESAGE
jgi:uncharacterized membrane protein YbhN (UPF0104 family)